MLISFNIKKDRSHHSLGAADVHDTKVARLQPGFHHYPPCVRHRSPQCGLAQPDHPRAGGSRYHVCIFKKEKRIRRKMRQRIDY